MGGAAAVSTELQKTDLLLLFLLFFAIIGTLVLVLVFGYWFVRQKDSLSPYTGTPMRRGETLSYYAKEQVLHFLYEKQDYQNQMFKLKDAVYCRETGRIFSNAITWYDVARVDWDFLQKRHPGHYVSWGSLTLQQQERIRRAHGSLDGFQTALSSRRPSPRDVEPEYLFLKPGPLYVDVNTMELLGWQCVPGTPLEVLIVQQPRHTGEAGIELSPPKQSGWTI